MPYEMQWGVDRVTVTFTGVVTTDEFVEGARAIGADPRFDELRFIVNDFSDATLCKLDRAKALEGLLESAVGGAVSNPAIRVAVVSPHREIFALAHEFRAVLNGKGPLVAVFEQAPQAREWMQAHTGSRFGD